MNRRRWLLAATGIVVTVAGLAGAKVWSDRARRAEWARIRAEVEHKMVEELEKIERTTKARGKAKRGAAKPSP
jgi:hypothetical protein